MVKYWKDSETAFVLGLVFLVWIGLGLTPCYGVAKEELVAGTRICWGDPGDGLGDGVSEGDPSDGLGGLVARKWGDPNDGLGQLGDPRDGLDYLRVYGDPGDGMDGRWPQIHGDPEDGLDFGGLLGDQGIAVLFPENWFILRGICIP
jgi:hypothetical protein